MGNENHSPNIDGVIRQHGFRSQQSEHHKELMKRIEDEESSVGKHLEPMFAGIAAVVHDNIIEVGMSANDATYSLDYTVCHVDGSNKSKEERSGLIANWIIETMQRYQNDHLCTFLGAGLTDVLFHEICPELASRIWSELDIVPMVFKVGRDFQLVDDRRAQRVDDQADSMARKTIMYFGPSHQPRIEVGVRNEVSVDAGGRVKLARLKDYEGTVSSGTWNTVMKYAKDLKSRNISIAFFNSTPQGGGVALMRHALVRFLRLLDIDCKWYVPRPRPEVFRITKTNHNILQGANAPEERLSEHQEKRISQWIQENADRYWLRDGGPLAARSDGGADVIFLDDPQMPSLIPLAKKADPDRLVLFRSHIQVRSDLVAQVGSPARGVWDYLWNDIKHADLFISHPVKSFVPDMVPAEMVGYMPATTDWLDGLNKKLNPWTWGFEHHDYNVNCNSRGIAKLQYPSREYIIQVARFDPAKGIPDLIKSYGKLRRHYLEHMPVEKTPQLVICGHGATDDPDGSIIYDQTMNLIDKDYPDLKKDISVIRLGSVDLTLNALLSQARIALQLSTSEGFEVKVSEALHKGIPVIATRTGGIPLQVQHEKSGFLVQPGDHDAVAKHLHDLLTDDALYDRMSSYAAKSVSDEVSTVGNAVSWLYLATAMSKGETVKPNGRWINDLARERAGEPYVEGENRLPRSLTT